MYCVNDCLVRFKKTYTKIKESGLLDNTYRIFVVLVGDYAPIYKLELDNYEKVDIILGNNPTGEMDSLRLLWDIANKYTCNILYLHSKGVSRPHNENIEAWIAYMEYFSIYQYEKCLESLKYNDAVGVDFYTNPMPHFSGNFWWSNSDYIKQRSNYDPTLSSDIKDERWYCEFWLLDQPKFKVECLHQSGVDLYNTNYTNYEHS